MRGLLRQASGMLESLFVKRLDFRCLILSAMCLSGVVACGDKAPEDEAPATVAPSADSQPTPVQAEQRENRLVAGAMLPYADIEGKLARGYFSYPTDMTEPLPAVILVHDRFGLTESFKRTADQIASQGYVAVAVDLFDGVSGKLPADTREPRVGLLEKPEPGRQNLASAIEFVETSFGSTGFATVGWGFGGLWAMNLANQFPDKVTALAVVQGQPNSDPNYLARLTMPLLAIYGASDRSVPIADVNAFRDALEAAGLRFEMRTFPEAGAGFMLPDSGAFNEGQSAEAWRLLVAFLADNVTSIIPEG